MKTTVTLSTVLFALSLSPAAFANGAQEQAQQNATVTSTDCVPLTASNAEQAPDATSVTRSVLEKFEIDVREEVLGSLRASSLLVEALQFAAPTLIEAGVSRKLDLTAR